MKISEKLVKQPWKRRVVVDAATKKFGVPHGRFKGFKAGQDGFGYATIELTQDDFLNEINNLQGAWVLNFRWDGFELDYRNHPPTFLEQKRGGGYIQKISKWVRKFLK